MPEAPLGDDQIALLPEASYDAVIPGLLTYSDLTRTSATAYTVETDVPIFGADRSQPVARFAAVNFLGEPSVLVEILRQDDWSLILTPSRRELPSQRATTASTPAAAQTAAWVPSEKLRNPREITSRIVVDVSDETLTILENDVIQHVFGVGVGTPDTPTPTNVTGYLQSQYLDPAQQQDTHRIQLTSLHATAADEPYVGGVGGLIGIHYQQTARGAVSHGCLRLDAEAIAAVDALPLGTLVTILP